MLQQMSENDRSATAHALPDHSSAPLQAPPEEYPERVQALLEGLNEPQREAVTHGEGPLLILAGAGSGKTRVLTHRVAFLIFTGQAHPSEILAITFTNKAAQEMRGRVEQLLGGSMRRMWLMTFHAACARIMRAHAERLGYTSRFTIYDQADSRRMVKRCIEEVGVDPKRFAPAAVHSQISQAKNKLLAASDCAQASGSPFEQVLAEVYQLYESELLRMNAMDFDDLLFRTVNLLELFEDVRTHYSESFKHILVDEYQDTNHAQYRLLQLLVGGGRAKPAQGEPLSIPGHRNLAVVGDDSQSIYSFRGADVSNILDFEKDFPDARVVKLEQNYRSTQTILSAANAVIANNRGGIAKRLWSDKGSGSPIRVHGLDDEHAEARFVVGEAERLVDEGASRSEIAIFYRTNAMSRVIEDTLVRREIAYQVVGGTKFYERAEIKDAVAYLAWIANPFDVVSFQRVANSPRRGLGQTSLSRIVAQCVVVRTTKARGWPDRFCWCSMFWSHVIMTAKPSACAAPISSPLPSVAQPIAAACVASRGRRSGIRCRGTLLSSRMRLPGISPCVIDDAPRPLNPQPWEQVVDLLGRGVVHVLGHAGRQDASTLHDRLAGHLPGNPFNVGTIGPVYFGRIAHGGARWFGASS